MCSSDLAPHRGALACRDRRAVQHGSRAGHDRAADDGHEIGRKPLRRHEDDEADARGQLSELGDIGGRHRAVRAKVYDYRFEPGKVTSAAVRRETGGTRPNLATDGGVDGYVAVEPLLESAAVTPTARAEDLSVADFVALARALAARLQLGHDAGSSAD